MRMALQHRSCLPIVLGENQLRPQKSQIARAEPESLQP